MISFDTNLTISFFIRGNQSFLYMVLDNRLIGIRSNWEPTIRIVKITIHFSTSVNGSYIITLRSVFVQSIRALDTLPSYIRIL